MDSLIEIPKPFLSNVTSRNDQLQHKVRQALIATGYVELRRVQVHINESEVCLSGSVLTYYKKQVAQEAVKRLKGVESLNNEITVVGN